MTKLSRILCATVAFLLPFVLCASAALAASPFSGGTETFKQDLIEILTPVAGIAVLAVGAMCLFGKMSWWWFVGLVIGIVLIFGSDQIVSWIRGAFGV